MSSDEPEPSMIVVASFVTVTFLELPSCSSWIVSNFNPFSSDTTVPPVRIAMSSKISLRRSPNPGDFTAATFRVPRILFTTRAASASPSMSSATIRSERPPCAVFSSVGRSSLSAEIFLSTRRM